MPFSDADDHVGKNAAPHCGPQFSKKKYAARSHSERRIFLEKQIETTLRPSHAATFPALLCDQAQENDGPA